MQYGPLYTIFGSSVDHNGTPGDDQGHGVGDGSSWNGHKSNKGLAIGDGGSGKGNGWYLICLFLSHFFDVHILYLITMYIWTSFFNLYECWFIYFC